MQLDPRSFQSLGLRPSQIQDWLTKAPERRPWRVSTIDRGLCSLVSVNFDSPEVDSSDANVSAHAEPRHPSRDMLTCRARLPETALAVGDWVLLFDDPPTPSPQVDLILQRTTLLRRGRPDGNSEEQLIAANVDTVFIVCAHANSEKLERRQLKAERLERYVSAVADAGATAVLVVNKVDVAADAAARLHELSARFPQLAIHSTSATSQLGLDSLMQYLGTGETVAFVGPSGVGKSSIVNQLMTERVQATSEVRNADTKGKHTTTRRQMHRTPTGALIIDTPGLRELAVLSKEGKALGFEDIDQLAGDCRFGDCQHVEEPGCAVQRAIAQGTLSPERLSNYQALSRDALRQQARHDAHARHLQHQQHRRFAKMVREATRARTR